MTKLLLHLFLSLSLLLTSYSALARDPEIRLYKMTRDGHSEKYLLFGKADNPGCHNTPYTYHVYKVGVFSFKNWGVFSGKNCQPETILTAYWKNKDKPATKFTRGTRWFLTRDGSEVDVSSWSCELK